ncbi:MAG TPA: hypothetical protein VGJ77_09660 [Gaiellaceae bacterium]
MKNLPLIVVLALAALGVALAPAAAAPEAPLLGVVFDGGQGHLARLDPETLQPLRTSKFLTNGYAVGPVLSPDGTKVALGSTSFLGARIVDLDTLASEVDLRATGESGTHVAATAWPVPDRLLLTATRCCPATAVLAALDPQAKRVLSVRRLRGTPVAAARTTTGLAILVAPAAGIGAARLVLFDPARLRVVPLTVRAGRNLPPQAHPNGMTIGKQLLPGLAVDAAGGRAYVLTGSTGAVEIDLATGRARPHTLARRTVAKALDGPRLDARWLGNGLVALTGTIDHVQAKDNTLDYQAAPAGLTLVDVRTWKARVVDRDATTIVVAGETLLARGYAQRPPTSIRAFDLTGRPRFELTDVDPNAWLQAAGDRAYVGNRVLELPSGRLLRRLAPGPRVSLLPTDGSQFPL